MRKNATRLFRQAVRAATASVKSVAEESGYTRVTFDKYLNERSPTEPALSALADALEARAERLADYAERLRAAVGDQPEGRPADAKAATRARRRRPAGRKGAR